MLKINELKNVQVTGKFMGERVEITKVDWFNQSVNIIKNVYGKKIRIAYNAADEFGSKLVLSNFTDIEIVEGKTSQKDKLKVTE